MTHKVRIQGMATITVCMDITYEADDYEAELLQGEDGESRAKSILEDRCWGQVRDNGCDPDVDIDGIWIDGKEVVDD